MSLFYWTQIFENLLKYWSSAAFVEKVIQSRLNYFSGILFSYFKTYLSVLESILCNLKNGVHPKVSHFKTCFKSFTGIMAV